jgi:hypothetical protein
MAVPKCYLLNGDEISYTDYQKKHGARIYPAPNQPGVKIVVDELRESVLIAKADLVDVNDASIEPTGYDVCRWYPNASESGKAGPTNNPDRDVAEHFSFEDADSGIGGMSSNGAGGPPYEFFIDGDNVNSERVKVGLLDGHITTAIQFRRV